MPADISVVVTCYNYARYLPLAVESVRRQTLAPLEIILVDDGSTDDTAAVAKSLGGAGGLRYVHQENKGQASAKNRGIAEAAGAFIAFLDADDLWEPSKLEKQRPLFDDPSVGVAYSRMAFIDAGGRPLARPTENPRLEPRAGRVTRDLLFDNFVPFSSAVVRRECLRHGAFDESLSMGIDWDLWLRISLSSAFAFVDEPLLLYRVDHAGQMSRNREERLACADRIMDNFRARAPGAVDASDWRAALAYTYAQRGYFYRGADLKKSTDYYKRSLRERWWQVAAWKGLAKNMLLSLSHLGWERMPRRGR